MARGALDDIRRIASRGAFDFRFGGSRGRAARFALYFASPRNTSRFTVEPGLWRAVPKFHTSENTGAGTPRAASRELTFCVPSQIRRRLVYVSFFLPETSFSHRFPHTEPGLQPNFARGTYQCRNSTSGCLLAPLRGLCHHFESAALPDSRPLTLRPPTQYSPT